MSQLVQVSDFSTHAANANVANNNIINNNNHGAASNGLAKAMNSGHPNTFMDKCNMTTMIIAAAAAVDRKEEEEMNRGRAEMAWKQEDRTSPDSSQSPDTLFRCSRCPLHFSEERHLTQHLLEDHIVPTRCPLCQNYVADLSQHIALQHPQRQELPPQQMQMQEQPQQLPHKGLEITPILVTSSGPAGGGGSAPRPATFLPRRPPTEDSVTVITQPLRSHPQSLQPRRRHRSVEEEDEDELGEARDIKPASNLLRRDLFTGGGGPAVDASALPMNLCVKRTQNGGGGGMHHGHAGGIIDKVEADMTPEDMAKAHEDMAKAHALYQSRMLVGAGAGGPASASSVHSDGDSGSLSSEPSMASGTCNGSQNGNGSVGSCSSSRKRRKQTHVPDCNKDERYWARRLKNNEAAKRSRDMRIKREKVVFEENNKLERMTQDLRQDLDKMATENKELHLKMDLILEENNRLKSLLLTYQTSRGEQQQQQQQQQQLNPLLKKKGAATAAAAAAAAAGAADLRPFPFPDGNN